MSLELSTPVKIIALVALFVVAGAAAMLLLLRGHSTSQPQTVATTPTHVRAPVHTHPGTTHHVTPPAARFVPGLPTPLVGPLSHSKVVVAVVWAKGDPVAADVLAQAKAGARLARAHLVILNVAGDTVARQTATWMNSNIVEPAVLVVQRPGNIAVELDGYTDKMAVAQAVVNTRG
jgi:hypothetical protein